MKRMIYISVALAMAALSACSEGAADLSEKAPELSLSDGASTVSLSDRRGEWVLLQFWNSTDTRSRLAARDGAELSRDMNISYMLVNLDYSEKLSREVARRDGMPEAARLHAAGASAERIIREYGLSDAMHSYLINPQGRIVARDPEPEAITRLVTGG